MFKKKSFNLKNEEELNKSKKSNSWVRFFITLGLVGFALLLILMNVDFSGNAYDAVEKSSTVSTIAYFTSTVIFENSSKSEFPTESDYSSAFTTKIAETADFANGGIINPYLQSRPENSISRFFNINTVSPSPRFEICKESNNGCTLTCQISSSDQKELNSKLEKQKTKCENHLELIIEASIFSSGTFSKNFLKGSYNLISLTLQNNANIYSIANNAFDNPSLNTLKRLIFINTQIDEMNEKTFLGLRELQYFYMINKQGFNTLKTKKFLKPVATTLNETLLCQETTPNYKYSPADWFDGENFVNLKIVDLSNNYFTDTLNQKSFKNLVNVQRLILTQCGIESFTPDTFDPIINTLEYLSLKNNKLKNLSPLMIITLKGQNIQFDLSSNSWDCNCNNFELIEAIKQNKIQLIEQPICLTPPELKDTELGNVKICCEDDEKNCEEKTEEMFSSTPPYSTRNPAMNPTSTTPIVEVTTTPIVHITSGTRTVTDTIAGNVGTSTPDITTNIKLVCSKPEGGVFTTSLQKPDAIFKLKHNSTTSVTIEFSAFPMNLSLIYSTNDKTQNSVDILLNNLITDIEDLTPDHAYVFCIVSQTEPSQHISPFNCRSQYMPPSNGSDDFSAAWLYSSDIPLFLSLALIGVIAFLLVGLFGTYFLLRWRPTLIRVSRRISLHSKRVLLTKTDMDHAPDKRLRQNSKSIDDYNGYLEYYSDFNRYNRNIVELTSMKEINSPPPERAPARPPLNAYWKSSLASTLSAGCVQEVTEDHQYESLEQYEKRLEFSLGNLGN